MVQELLSTEVLPWDLERAPQPCPGLGVPAARRGGMGPCWLGPWHGWKLHVGRWDGLSRHRGQELLITSHWQVRAFLSLLIAPVTISWDNRVMWQKADAASLSASSGWPVAVPARMLGAVSSSHGAACAVPQNALCQTGCHLFFP